MKCSNCNKVISEANAKFCSACGTQLLSTELVNTTDPGLEGETEKSLSLNPPSLPVEHHESNKSSEQVSDNSISTKKKKKRKKRTRKKKDVPMSLDPDPATSHEVKRLKKGQEGGDSTDSGSADNAMDEAPPHSLTDVCASADSEPRSLVAHSTARPASRHKKGSATAEPGTGSQHAASVGKRTPTETRSSKSTVTETSKPGPVESASPPVDPEADTVSESQDTGLQSGSTQAPAESPSPSTNSDSNMSAIPQTDTSKGVTDTNDKKPGSKTSKTNKEKGTNKNQPSDVDHNANQTEQVKEMPGSRLKGQKDQEKPTNEKVFGPNTPPKAAARGSSVDPPTHGKGDASAPQTPDNTKKKKDDNRQSKMEVEPPPERMTRSSKAIASKDRLTIYFHAVLSKDFKFDPNEDRIFIRAGDYIGSWDKNTIELSVTKDLGEHGFLVEGQYVTTKDTAQVSIPYKYVVYKMKKNTHEFEYIYKLDSQHTTNRCLFVKPHLLNVDGDWHQYDDIICAEPSKNMLKRFKDAFWPDQRKSVIQGREIAGKIMLETIFDIPRIWNYTNLTNFQIHLNQFIQIYANPSVYEEKHKQWNSLNYGMYEVKMMVKQFMLENVTPQLLKDGNGKSLFIPDPMRAALILLYVWKRHDIHLKANELHQLCTALCLPKMDKEDFLQYWDELSHALSAFKNLPDILVALINVLKKEKMPRWILAIPLLHLVKGTAKPFQQLPISPPSTKYNMTWAGLQGIDMDKWSHLNSQDRTALLNLMNKHTYLVEVDSLAARSWMFLMPIDDLIECSICTNIGLSDMLHLLNLKTQEINYSNYETVSKILSHIQGNLIEHKYNCVSDAYRRECMATAVKLLDKICKEVKSYNKTFTDLPVACMNLVTNVIDQAYDSQVDQNVEKDQLYAEDFTVLCQATNIMREWISQTFRDSLLNRSLSSLYQTVSAAKGEIEMWNNIISLHLKNDDFTRECRKMFTMDFEGKFKQESALDQTEYYCSNIEDLSHSHPHVASSVEKCALEAVTSLCQTKSEGKLLERFKINWKFGPLMSAIIQKSWPSECQDFEDEEVIFQHILSWTAAKTVFQLHGAEEKLTEKLSIDAKEKIAIAISSFTAITNQLIHGNIKINLLNFILKKRDDFLNLLKIECLCENDRWKDNAKMRRLLQSRQDEVNAVYHEKELLDVLLAMCHKLEDEITVDIMDLKKEQQINIPTMTLNQFMEVHTFDQLPTQTAGKVTYFDLDEDVRAMAEDLHTFKDSHLFQMCWKKHTRKLAALERDPENTEEYIVDLMATPDMISDEIFHPCNEDYKCIYKCLQNGDITLGNVDGLFKDFKGKYEKLVEDFEIMCRIDKSNNKQWIQTRVQQIEQYHELHLAVESAQKIMMVKETLGLQGDFKVLQTLLDVTHKDFKREHLSRIDNDLMQAKLVLVDITEPRKMCLEELGNRRHFVNWVKEALEDINELKVFVDLASISAGENDLDVDRVACFHDAVLGYSSMLYDLKQDSGFKVLKEVLKKLWKALDSDSNLPKKLRDSARHLEWLKTVKESHGSVELSSLSLASAINSKGIYIIRAHNAKKLSLATALELQIPEEHDDSQEIRCYSLEDLRELQNKLMLMSGKGDQGQSEVEYFAEIFANVQRLAEAFIALYAGGNPLFRNWEAQINCLSGADPSITMDFNLGSLASAIFVEGKIEEQLPELCRKMEKCLDYWMDFVDKQRSQHYYLNYYTAEQIVYLCSKLTQQNVSKLEDQVLMMLSFIKPNCTIAYLRQVWHKLQYELLIQPQEQNEDIEFQTFVELPESSKEDTESLGDLGNLQSIVNQTRGSQKFDLIWNAYMKNMKNFLPDILDTNSLGMLLEILANNDGRTEEDVSDEKNEKHVNRELPKGLTIGNPNLIVCTHDEVLTSCISVYMSSELEVLPTYDEVLLCNPSTSYEQVELFLRRCLTEGYPGHKIYTLLYGDMLTYDVSSKVESFFQRRKMQSKKDYRLVMICSTEREHAYLPSAFSQYRLHMVPQEPLARIQRYLTGHYIVPADESTAAAVFKDRLCVGVVSSQRAGVGKSLYIKRLYEKLTQSTQMPSALKCIRLIEPTVDENAILQSLSTSLKKKHLTIYHFDISSSVQKGLQEFLFKLLVLRYLMDSEGQMWSCSNNHLYVVEILQQTLKVPRSGSWQSRTEKSSFIKLFPNIFCRPPKDVLMLEMGDHKGGTTIGPEDPLMDEEEFESEAFQRTFQYLTRFYKHIELDAFVYNGVEGSHVECLQMLLMYCGILDPSWAELRNFAWFLNLQLKDCETSVFCDATFTGDTLKGFKNFVVDFMILMAKDFATPSLSISDQSPGRLQVDLTGVRDEDLAPFLIRKRWESEPHPYIFFNDDHTSMTFIGFHLKPNEQTCVDAIDPLSGRVIKRNIMTIELYEGLMLQRVPFNIDFDKLPRGEKIERLCNVLGIQWPLDPDETYELTTDNMLKMLAIHMRFRCGIPVIIMGETGCGKTRLIKFLCELRRSGVSTENMKLVKVHGGTSSHMIHDKVREAEAIALLNKQDYDLDSVLFFDEANTTEAISSIKEILCDKTVEGECFTPNCGLQIIAACNPYRKHTEEMIQRLESAGLGYRVRAEETDEKLGSIPLRQLVYRVQALPPSLIPLVWDFGQLNDHTEEMYIQQIVQRVVERNAIKVLYIKMITDVLSASQRYMRTRKDECSFVSLRDVERCMQAFVWFYDNHTLLFAELEQYEIIQNDNTEMLQRDVEVRDPVIWSLIMAVGVCYHACLENKDKYRQTISENLPDMYSQVKIMQEISIMQDLLLSGVPMGETIARNSALKENVFMMVLCIELRIPLFLVGKPGSSKSLSKTLVADAMQGQAAHAELYKKLKQVHLVSFQCSPHSTPEGIINTFKQCGRFQEGKNLNEYISVVVLDEIGLAEDSPKMPLKTLHPLLEEGCIDDEPLPHKKVGFIGISNWALDPAKMNRGIFVSRGDPDEKELVESAKGICSSDAMLLEKVSDFFKPFAKAYLKICKKQGKRFFGLRDYYSLIKMIFAVAKASQQKPSAEQIVEAVLRNFSGRDDVNAVTVFTQRLQIAPNLDSVNAIELVRQNIEAIGQDEECRYLLVLTKNYAALQILQQNFFLAGDQPEIIFGSSFPKDQEYTQICRNINRVKICMETGQTVVLLNLQNLYESLYDALNQYYVFLGGQQYVDLGLGTHRVKCRVHKNFRLIVIEEKEVVYKQFPIPLINRLEKHYLDIHTVLNREQKNIVKKLEQWVQKFVSLGNQHAVVPQAYKYKPPDVFIGYHSDTCASVVLQMIENQRLTMETSDRDGAVLDDSKLTLLNCATPDSVVRLDCTGLPKVESEHLSRVYFEEQNNSCLAEFILAQTNQDADCRAFFTEVTTFSRLLTASDLEPLEQVLHSVELLSLQQFDTEYSFLKKISHFLTTEKGSNTSENKILIIQCDFDEASNSSNLIASAKYSSINAINKMRQNTVVFVYFITKLPRMEGGTPYIGFHGGPWRSVHIDDLRRSKDIVSDIKALRNMTISQLFEKKIPKKKEETEDQPEAMEVDDTENDQSGIEDEDQTGWENVLDTTALVRSCVQCAVGMLRDQGQSGVRSTRRLEILLTLLTDSEEINANFLSTVKKRLHSLLVTHDSNNFSMTNWVIKEASNIDALQEGGTFRHTLWKRVQAVVIPLLAQLVSVIDRDQNMDILLDTSCGKFVKKLWLDIFGDDKLLDVPYMTLDRNSETKTILVQNFIVLDNNISCSMPFSWRIKDFLDELWVHALQHEGHTQCQFDEFFLKTPLGRYISAADLEMQSEFFQRYLQDFVCMTMNVKRQEDLQLLCGALHCSVNEMLLRHNAVKEVTSLPWVHSTYREFKTRLQNLLRMISIEPQVTQFLLRNNHTNAGPELVLDVYAAVACVECLEPQTLDTYVQRQAWLRQVKKLQVPIELICSEDSMRHYGERSKTMVCRVQTGWNRIFSLSLFVEHMLLGVEDIDEKLKPLVLEHTSGLGQILEHNSDLKTQQSFEAVINNLKACKDGAVKSIFKFGLQPCPVCMGDPQDPLSLPCDHIYCVACIKQWLIPGQMYCPLCMQGVPDDFPIVTSNHIKALISQYAQFRKQCNVFFIDLVSTVCFKDNTPPCRAIILHLLSFLMVEANSVNIIKRTNRTLTKALTPFHDSVDKNPVVRSVILKLLLKYSFDVVKDYLQKHLTAVEQSNIVEESDKTELYSLYINCLEDAMFERVQFHTAAEQQACLQCETAFLTEYLRSGAASGDTATVEYLQQLARVRVSLDMAANLIVEQRTAAEEGTQELGQNASTDFLTSVMDLFRRSGNDWYRVYLIRKICSQQGVEFVQKLLKVGSMRWLFPDEILRQCQEDSPIDQFLVCGEDYKTIREAVAGAMMAGKVEGLEETCEKCKCPPQQKAVYLLLALFREVTSLYKGTNVAYHPKPEQREALVAFIQDSKVLTRPEVKTFAEALISNQLQLLTVQPGVSGAPWVVIELTVHLAAVLLCGTQGVLAPLQQVALSPANMQRAFLPTMPEDMLAVAHQAMGPLQWYHCPNGHPCTIGECGQPMEKSHCLDCGADIGGANHRPVQGFTVFQMQGDRTQPGHILGDPSRRDNPDMLDTKNISPVPFNLMRMLTHMAMLLGACNHPQVIYAIIKPPVADTAAFLLGHLLKDVGHLTRSLGKGTDDTVTAVHMLIHSFLEPNQPQQWPVPYDIGLSTKDFRNGWELTVSNTVLTPQLKHLDRQLKEVNKSIRTDSRVSTNPVVKMIFGDPRLFLASLPRGSVIHGSAVWSCREKVSLLSLGHIVEQNDGKDTLPVLWRFLHREAEVRLVKFLPEILTLQRDLVKKFQNVTDLTFSTIDDFLQSQKAASFKARYERLIKIFLTTWNQLRVSLATNGEIKIQAEFCREDLDMTSDFKVLLPRRQGQGLCSTALVSYLIALHNDLIYCVDKYTGEETSYKVSPADLTDLHVIHYELERDVMPLVLANAQYSMERGQETLHEYDLPKIQRQILTRFLQGKPLITLHGIPTLVNRHDRNYEIILKDVKEKVIQEPLQTLTQSALTGALQAYSEVCEALSTVEVALGFLAMTGGEPGMQLSCYLEEVLQMGDQTATHILKALSMCCLRHCVALWQLLIALKSEKMLRLKRDPFVGISGVYKQALGEEERRLLTGFFSRSSAEPFFLEMHEFLLLVLKDPSAPETFKPDWGLKVTLVSHMERKSLDIPPDVEEFFPEQICLSQYVEAWKFTVAFKQERNQR